MRRSKPRSEALRFPRARITLPLLAAVAASLAFGPSLFGAQDLDEASALGLASERGILPLVDWPAKGTEIFQWDPELRDFAPFSIGFVVDEAYHERGKRYALVRRPHAPGLFIDVEPHALRYWTRKPSP